MEWDITYLEYHLSCIQHPVSPRQTVQENIMPHVYWAEVPLVSYMGKYDLSRDKIKTERRKDFRNYLEQVV